MLEELSQWLCRKIQVPIFPLSLGSRSSRRICFKSGPRSCNGSLSACGKEAVRIKLV